MSYDFKGNNAALVRSIHALISLDTKGALAPNCLGEMARQLLEASASRLTEQHQGEPVAYQVRVKGPDGEWCPWFDVGQWFFETYAEDKAEKRALYAHSDPVEVEALRGAYLRAGEREHELRTELAQLRAALKFYADRDHYSTDDGSSWDSCSGEPANILWHESEPWFIEDGSIARAALERKASDDIPDFTPGNGNKAERRATKLLAQLQSDLTERDQQIDALSMDAVRYRWLRSRDLGTISQGGVFAGLTPDNLVLNEETLDQAIDAAMAKPKCRHCGDTGQIMVGRSGQAEDGNAPIMEPCEDCDRGMPDLASRPEERGTPETEPCSGCGTPGWTGVCNKCVPY
ncbi:hypothetical protein H4C81_14370 [Pseudomonas monteilii]|uniref:hypothetical protein n=1 Tax=Pseudomonas monteilii TaxID=76759 RepID=UPI0015F938B4|nr:hypothetical protein [Pseudomonas monteilii]MBA6090070.1 hypothetical protein [Pseudomonas monteilii]